MQVPVGSLRRWCCGVVVFVGMAIAAGVSAEAAKAPDIEAIPVVPAQLLHAWWIDDSEGLDVSGLSFCNGDLLAVSDKSSERIYRLSPKPGNNRVQLAPWADFSRPPLPDDQPVTVKARALHYASKPLSMDFEGITCDDTGIYLLSERHNRIARFDRRGNAGLWLPVRWSESARARGFLQLFNAESEGLVKVAGDFWVALERDPRGLLKLAAGDRVGKRFYPVPPVPGLDFRGRSEDLTALAFYDGALFTLERNAFAVCRRDVDTLEAEWCIQYRDIEEGEQYVYRETRFGKGEGLAVSRDGIFVVLDNNGVTRVAAPQDSRGLLLQLAFPAASGR
ncbi:esterase-like activity of phytase family protein [Microbulbifer mangrovi]|uniref:esterase-like activity of phytase family protein n=1 Tax=Microbulbifer mangrovi TaxID=927787 RepID=UPI00118082D8|nr:esterase-like activity of phytase family protein [Microbulbifer mangrovi]